MREASCFFLGIHSQINHSVLVGAAESGNVNLFDWLIQRFDIPPDELDVRKHKGLCGYASCIHLYTPKPVC